MPDQFLLLCFGSRLGQKFQVSLFCVSCHESQPHLGSQVSVFTERAKAAAECFTATLAYKANVSKDLDVLSPAKGHHLLLALF